MVATCVVQGLLTSEDIKAIYRKLLTQLKDRKVKADKLGIRLRSLQTISSLVLAFALDSIRHAKAVQTTAGLSPAGQLQQDQAALTTGLTVSVCRPGPWTCSRQG